MDPAAPRLIAPLALAAALLAGGCRDPIESAPGPRGREARPLPLPSTVAPTRSLESLFAGRAEAQPPPARPRPAPAGAPAAASAASRLGVGAAPARPTTTPGFAQSAEAMLLDLEQSEPRVVIPLGGSSVLRLRFESGLAAVYRPKTRGQPDAPAAEVAAYRIAAALGIDQVPPAALRRMTADDLERRFSGNDDEWDALRRAIAAEPDGAILGAAIAYETDLRSLGLEQPRKRAEWQAWLAHGGEIPEESRALARDLSRMVAFDYLIGNRERFDDPLRGPREGGRVLLRNHDKAFSEPLATGIERRLRADLRATERFSRTMIAGLAALDRAALESLLAASGEGLLDAAAVEGVLERRETILSYVEALCDRHGSDEVFFFD